jgi:hypothetical protein
MSETEIILDTDPDIVEFRTDVSGWVSKKGDLFFGKDERAARYHASTHTKCSCGEVIVKGWYKCSKCITEAKTEHYWKLPLEVWDYKKPICTYDGEHYFFDEGDLIDFLEENPEVNPLLVICKPNYASEIPLDFWEDAQTEDGELPDELIKKLTEFNKFIATLEPLSYSPSQIRTQYIKP